MTSEYMHISGLFLKKLYKNSKFSLEFLPVAREFQMPGHWIIRSLL
jgi:hypothetical protein